MTDEGRLAVPDLLSEGRWAHAFIVTYNADLRFYETDIWSRLSARNCVVLVDADQLPTANAEAGRLRHANVRYVLEPIVGSTSAHAKLIWLSSPEEGALLIGSGNLTTNGYAGDGELFTVYRHSTENTDNMAAFQAAREFLDALVDRGHVTEHVRPHLNRAWSDSPWLHEAPSGERTVRHNLDQPLLEQLVERIAGRGVESIVLHAPFHDRRCEALRRCLDALRPGHVEVLVQDGETSVEADALRSVLDNYGKPWVVRTARGRSPATYLHAKFVLARLASTEVCLQGSPNLSLAALTRTPPQGNIEVANLLEGPRAAFDSLVDALETEPGDPATLRLSFRGDDQSDDETANRVRLLAGRLVVDELTLQLSRPVPEDAAMQLLVGDDVPHDISLDRRGTEVRAGLPDALAAWLAGRVRPVSLRITDPSGAYDTNPVYPAQAAELDKLLVGQRDPESLRRIGQVDLGVDEDISSLLTDLADALPLDRRSLWRTVRPAKAQDDDAPRTMWNEIDWDAVRRHPVLTQYQALAARRVEPTDLQLLLAAAGGGLPKLVADPSVAAPAGISEDEDEDEADVDAEPGEEEDTLAVEEIAAREAERERRRLTVWQRNRRASINFLTRLINGLEDGPFIEVIGPVTAVTNAVLADRLMTLLVARGHLEVKDALPLQIRLWRLLWGRSGLTEGLDSEEAVLVDNLLTDHSAVAHTVGGLYLAERGTRSGDWSDERIQLRELWRALLGEQDVSPEVASAAVGLIEVNVDALRDALRALAWETYESEVLVAVSDVLGVPKHQVGWRPERVTVRGRVTDVSCLVVEADIQLDVALARRILGSWYRLQPDLGYWRCQTSAGPVVRDVTTGESWWWSRSADEFFEIEGLPRELDEPWVHALDVFALAATSRAAG